MSEKKNILSVKSLSAGYKDFPAVADMSFTLGKGEILCVVGESGCGKSTLLKSLLGVDEALKIMSGSIELDGRALTSLSLRERRGICGSEIGMVFQNPGASFNPIRSYAKQFKETLKSHGRYNAESFMPKVRDSFLKLGLSDWERIIACCPYEMSGGMNQRIALALAMLLGHKILLADEPTSALDATIQLQVAGELKSLRKASGMAQIVVTHNLALAQFLADTIGVMYAGRLIEYGTADALLHRPLHPYTKSLIAAVPSLRGKMPKGLQGQHPPTGPSLIGCEFAARCSFASDSCVSAEYTLFEAEPGHACSCMAAIGGLK